MAFATVLELNKNVKAISEIVLKIVKDQEILLLPKPSAFNFQPGTQTQTIEAAAGDGVMAPVGIYDTRREPRLELSFPTVQLELFATQFDRRLQESTAIAVNVPMSFKVRSDGSGGGMFPAAVTDDQIQFSVVEDQETLASVKANELTLPLSKLPYADWSTWKSTATLSFAVGANGELVFSDDLLGAEGIVEFQQIPLDVTEFASDTIGLIEISTILVDSDNKINLFSMESAQIDKASANLQVGSGTSLSIIGLASAGNCEGFNLRYTGKKVSC